MTKEIQETSGAVLDLQNTRKLCEMLIATPHYKKMGPEGIYAIVQKAQSLGLNPLEALNGGLYYVNGKVEMQANLMARMIRQAGHSFTPGKECDQTICVLHGKRKDNGDTWRVSFTIEEAKRAGIYREGGPWSKYPEDMLYSRALSRLARRLFPDVIGNCYTEGEIRDSNDGKAVNDTTYIVGNNIERGYDEVEVGESEKITAKEADHIDELIGEDHEYRNKVMEFLNKRFGVSTLYEMPKLVHEQIKKRAIENFQNKELNRGEA